MRHLFSLLILFSLLTSNIRAQEATRSIEKVDVVVVGAGSAGVPAAIQAARLGASTLLLESGAHLGGNATSGGVNFPGLFHAWGKQVISGIGWEWVVKTLEVSNGTLPDFTIPTGKQHWQHQIRVNIPAYIAIGEEMCMESGVDLRYYESPVTITSLHDAFENETEYIEQGYHWKMTTSAMGELKTIYCRQAIDCTGNGALVALAGGQRIRENETQPGTFNYTIKHNVVVTDNNKQLIQAAYDAALQESKILPGDARSGIIDFLKDSSRNYVYGADNSTASTRTATNLRGRQAALRMLRFIHTLPNGNDAIIVSMSPEVGVRETWRIVGELTITHDDYIEGRKWEDSLCYAFYPIDLHEDQSGVAPKHLHEDVVPTIPLRALLVKNIPNLQAAGRCISSDRLANSALRVQATCMASGQVAGVTAAMAALKNTSPNSLSIEEIKDSLRESGAIVP